MEMIQSVARNFAALSKALSIQNTSTRFCIAMHFQKR